MAATADEQRLDDWRPNAEFFLDNILSLNRIIEGFEGKALYEMLNVMV